MTAPAPARASSRRAPAALVVAALWTVAWTVAAAALTGAASALVLVDAGPIVRWGLPIVDGLADLASALVLAGLVLGVTVLPRREGATPHPASKRALDIAAGAAIAWGLLLILRLILGYGLAAGQAPFTPRFGSDLTMYATSIELGQYQLAAVVAAAAASALLVGVRSRTTLVLALVLALTAITAKAMTGHASGQSTHEVATSSMVLHLAASGVWLGGLALLVLLAGRLGDRLPEAAARFSVLALACYAVLTASGILSAAVRLFSPAELVTHSYGRLLLGKIVLLVVLGGAGWMQRRRSISRLRIGGGGRPFLRLVLGEVFLVGAATGLAATLSNSEPPVPDEPDVADSVAEQLTWFPLPAPPDPTTLLTAWRLDAAGLALALGLAALHLWVLLRAPDSAARGAAPARPSRPRILAWYLGCAVIAWATCGAPGVYAPVQFSAHLAQHGLLALVAAPLLIAGGLGGLVRSRIAPRTDGSLGLRELVDAAPRGRIGRLLNRPVVLAPLGAALFAALYLTPALEIGVERTEGRALLLPAALAAGAVLALGAGGRRFGDSAPAGRRERLLAVALATLVLGGFSVLLGTWRRALQVDWFGVMGRTWNADALADQHLAGWELLAVTAAGAAVATTAALRSGRR